MPFLVGLQIDVNLHLMLPISHREFRQTEGKDIPCSGSEEKLWGQLS